MYEVLRFGPLVLPCLLSLLPEACAQPNREEAHAWHKPSVAKQQPEGCVSRQTLERWCKVTVSSVSSCPNCARTEAHGQAKPGPRSTCVRQACSASYDLKALAPKEFGSQNQSHHRAMPMLYVQLSWWSIRHVFEPASCCMSMLWLPPSCTVASLCLHGSWHMMLICMHLPCMKLPFSLGTRHVLNICPGKIM